jgi:2-(1,2-epoxy-1,2-dihydrophenyl)acetyl-CoA isomerase
MNRPEALNSLNTDLAQELILNLAELNENPDVNVVVLTGAGKAFCAGGDLKALKQLGSELDAVSFVRRCGEISRAITMLKKPVIGMVNGVAAGAGFNLALACDLITCAENVRFIQSFSSVGLIPDCGGHWLLPRAVGPWLAKKLIYFAEPVDARRAMELGFVCHISQPENLWTETAAMAESLALRPPLALRQSKELILNTSMLSFDEVLERESMIQGELLMGEDCAEGISAFIQKRKPDFKGIS